MALHVELDHTGSVLLAGDALYTHESYGPPPAVSPMNPGASGEASRNCSNKGATWRF
jgi:hypothetical protein